MSDTDAPERKGGYRLEYAPNNRAKCKGPKPCSGTTITKGEIRVGSLVDFRGHTSFSWRHWGCVTAKLITNMKEIFGEADELDGFDDLKEADQEKLRKAWEEGHVDDADIPDSARKPAGEEEEEEDDEGGSGTKKSKGKKADAGGSNKFKLEYAASARAKCKKCNEQIGKNFFRLGHEVDFRGNKSLAWTHWGCSSTFIQNIKSSYASVDAIEGYSDLKDDEKEKVKRAYDEGDIPEDDRGIGEAVEGLEKKKVVRKKKKEESEEEGNDDGEEDRPKKRVRKAKKDDDEDKPKKRAAPVKKTAASADKKKPAATKKAPPKPAAPKKKKKADTEESGEDFGDDLDNISGDEEEEEEPEQKKRKRPAAKPKASSSNSKPAPKVAPAKPASKRATKPASKTRKQAVEYSDDDE